MDCALVRVLVVVFPGFWMNCCISRCFGICCVSWFGVWVGII